MANNREQTTERMELKLFAERRRAMDTCFLCYALSEECRPKRLRLPAQHTARDPSIYIPNPVAMSNPLCGMASHGHQKGNQMSFLRQNVRSAGSLDGFAHFPRAPTLRAEFAQGTYEQGVLLEELSRVMYADKVLACWLPALNLLTRANREAIVYDPCPLAQVNSTRIRIAPREHGIQGVSYVHNFKISGSAIRRRNGCYLRTLRGGAARRPGQPRSCLFNKTLSGRRFNNR